jgi:hypothetical protein
MVVKQKLLNIDFRNKLRQKKQDNYRQYNAYKPKYQEFLYLKRQFQHDLEAHFGIAFFLGREHAQYQHKLGYTLPKTFQAFAFWKWSRDAQLDLLFPIIACSVIYGISRLTD